MQSRKTKLKLWVFALVLCASLAAASIYGAFISQKQNELSQEKPLLALENLRRKYAAIDSVHIIADAKIAMYGEDFRVGLGRFEYWARGNKYRTKTSTDKLLKLNTDLDVAYDGERFYYFDQRSGILSYRSTDDLRSHAALPNPLFLPLDYLSNDDDECPLCKLRLSQVKSDNVRWGTRARSLEVKAKRHESSDRVITDVEMPGGKMRGRPFKLRMRLVGTEEDNANPLQIERISPEGQVLSVITFDGFMDNSSLPMPRDILITVFDANGNVALRLEYTIKLLEINQSFDNRIFTISFDDAEGVWDTDGRRFVKEKKPKGLRE